MLSATLLLAFCNLASAQAAESLPPGLDTWWQQMHSSFDALAKEREIVPPVPRKLRWRPSRIWSGELDGELLDVTAGDLDGDGRSELYALTTEKLIVLSRSRGLFDVRAQFDLPSAPAQIRSREPIGIVELAAHSPEATLRVRSSEQAQGAVYQQKDGVLSQVAEFAGYPLCGASTIEAAPGRNYFVGASASVSPAEGPVLRTHTPGGALYSIRCSRGLVDPTGHPLHIVSEVSTARRLRVQCVGDEEYCVAIRREFDEVGYAQLVVDIDNDGVPELVTTSASLPHEADRITVRSLSQGAGRVLFENTFPGGVVAIAAGDFEGDDSLAVVVAVRKQERVSLWLLN